MSPGIISIHALREEGDYGRIKDAEAEFEFLSTPSARRATSARFYRGLLLHISIHALREEGDISCTKGTEGRKPFLSTPSARRATVLATTTTRATKFLSTPSARRATSSFPSGCSGNTDFYPRPPRGGRQIITVWEWIRKKFLSTPSARRATTLPSTVAMPWELFLSTPSARRATAKTETKSLFSNKLYNILHEFRRALIYNGSKNYPNHAK